MSCSQIVVAGSNAQDERLQLRSAFLEGMSRVANTVSVVTSDGPAGRAGVTVSAMTSVSADDGRPALLVCIHNHSRAAEAIRRNGVFCVNLLRENQSGVADRFAGRITGGSADKFDGADWAVLKTGAPIVSEALVSFDCELTASLRQGSHWIFIGAVTGIVSSGDARPLVYANRSYVAVTAASKF
jgi:flavin reductase (DIM6/NTAB) family NADH-FMN oxidoreductase RutF